ncbi:MAG: nitroreductase family protein [Actinobacteria bacterium]|nr:nitroreductase family protein [Actinomycetota bacterium]
MHLAEVVGRRRMVRRYRPDPVDPAVVEVILDTARRGPSAGFAQGVDLLAVTDDGTRHRIAELCDEPDHVAGGRDPWLSVAPVHVVPCVRPAAYRARYAEPDKAGGRGPGDWPVPFWWIDGGAALMLLLLAAVDAGLGAGLLDVADRHGLRELLDIPVDVEPLGVVTLGHAAEDQPASSGTRRARRKLSDQVHWQRW